MSAPSATTSADLTRMNAEMTELGLRHRRAIRSVLFLLVLFATFAIGVGYFGFTKLRDSRPGPTAASLSLSPPLPLPVPIPVPVPVPESESPPPRPAPTPSVELAPRDLPASSASLRAESPQKNPRPAAALARVARAVSAPKPDAAQSFGFLTIDTSPWSQVSVGGRSLGQTPLLNVKLPAGSQVLSLRNPEQGIETSYRVTIESGKTTMRRIGIE